jgi:hypothetical protein
MTMRQHRRYAVIALHLAMTGATGVQGGFETHALRSYFRIPIGSKCLTIATSARNDGKNRSLGHLHRKKQRHSAHFGTEGGP